MPEYLAPGVYIEETSFRAKSIEGVSTSTAGFIGPTRTGPISGQPELLTSFADFERYYGGLEDLKFGSSTEINHVAHAVRAFFEEGGKRCYVARVYKRTAPAGGNATATTGHATFDLGNNVALTARFPGQSENMRVRFRLRIGEKVLHKTPASGPNPATYELLRAIPGDVVFVNQATALVDNVFIVTGEGTSQSPFKLKSKGAAEANLNTFDGKDVFPLTMVVEIENANADGSFGAVRTFGEFSLNTRSKTSFQKTFTAQPPTRYEALTIPLMIQNAPAEIADLLAALFPAVQASAFKAREIVSSGYYVLDKGADGDAPQADEYQGEPTSFLDLTAPDNFTKAKNGLLAFEATPDISIVAVSPRAGPKHRRLKSTMQSSLTVKI